jgi:N-acyl-D-amino-acid deacylase
VSELLIKNASIIDGSGRPVYPADLLVSSGKIARIGRDLDLSYPETIDARGQVLCPGFIDMHSHSDFTLLLAPMADSRVRQGVTTEVTGNCGGSPGPILDDFRDAFMEYMTDLGKYYKQALSPGDWNWRTLDEFFLRLGEQGTAVNMVPLVGQSTLRANVMGYAERRANAREMRQMQDLLKAELEKGAFGMSTGLIYHPGAFADTAELAELASVLPVYGGIYSTHIRSEGRFLFEGVQEAVDIARISGASLQISHLKSVKSG